MKRILLVFFIGISVSGQLHSQSCTATSFDVDLSASIDTTVTFQSTRNGDCCTGNNCIRFNLTINPACSFVNFTVQNPAPPGNAAYYQVDCGPQTSLGTPICIVGKTNVVITFCKPGNDNPIYTITAAGALKGSDDITVREGCTGTMNVSGLLPATITWTSIYPGPQGTYDAYLSCTSGCTTTNVTPLPGSPPYIDYEVSGFRICGPIVSDTIRVYTTPQIAVAITPTNSSVCAGGSTNVTLTATASGGDAPYSYLWNTAQPGQSITVNTGGTYSVSVTDTNNCLPAVQSVTVATTPLPTPPTINSNSPVCQGNSLNLFASTVAGATYSWTGPNGFISSLQNPVISNTTAANAGNYSLTVTVGQCTSNAVNTTVVVNPIPSSPSATNNSAVCEGTNLNLTASAIAGASYNWTGPNGFTSSNQNPVINNVSLTNAGSYNVTATLNGCTSSPSSTTAVVNPLPAAPSVSNNGPLCNGNTISLMAATISGATYSWTGPGGFTSASQNPSITNAGVNASGIYAVQATVNACTGPAGTTSVIVNPIPPSPTVSSNGPVCEGSPLNFTASSIAGANYSWTGPNGFSSSLQNPSIINTTTATSGSYSVTATVNGCTSATNNTLATVKPLPSTPIIGSNSPVCEGSTLSLTASTIAGAIYSWGGPNGFVSSSQNPTIANVTTLHTGVYSVNAKVNGCTGSAAIINVMVNLIPSSPVSSSNSPVCSGTSILLNASTIAGASYSWAGPNGFTSAQQNPVISNASLTNGGVYTVSVTVNGCTSTIPASIPVTVNQTPNAPLITNNGPLCEGSILNLSTSNTPGANYSWTGPNGFTSSSQNNSILSVTAANKGIYYVTATTNGCTSSAANTSVIIDQPAIANAGSDQLTCSSNSFVKLAGTISGGNGSGVWSGNGSGIFSPANTNLNADYSLTNADKAAGNISLTLSSTNNGACPASSSSILIRFATPPTASAGSDQTVCANNANVVLNGQFNNATSVSWTTSGTGSFTPSNTTQNAIYIPGASDKTNGSVKLTLTTIGNGPCTAASDVMVLTIKTPPVINGAGVKYVIEQSSTVLSAIINGSNLNYLWAPGIYLNNDTIPNPLCTPINDVLYKLIVKDALGCASTGDIMVKVLKHPQIPNVFTPNSDGINDRWQIKYLSDYPDCRVDIYDRYGQLIYQSVGYSNAWDGTSKGKPLPAGTYYYIIDPKNDLKPLSGFVDIVK
jgi:gliding motility-associated-like protein